MFVFLLCLDTKVCHSIEYTEGLELKRTMSTLVGFEIIEFKLCKLLKNQEINQITSFWEKMMFGVISL